MRGAGYEFVLRTSRAWLWIACVGAVLGILGGGLLVASSEVSALGSPIVRIGADVGIAAGDASLVAAVAGGVILAISAVSLRRSLRYACECKVGEAGIYAGTLLAAEEFIPWARFRGASVRGRLVTIAFDSADGIDASLVVEAPRGAGATLLRLRTYLADRERALASERAKAAAPPLPAEAPASA